MGLFNKKKDTKEEVHGDIKTPALPIKSRNKASDDHLYSEVITRSEVTGIMILVSYTEEYFYDMIEFISAANTTKLHVITTHSSYEESIDKTDKYGEPITICHDRYYALISGYEYWYVDVFNNISNLSNAILEAITQDLYEVARKSCFKELIDNGILEDLFIESTDIPVVDSNAGYTETDHGRVTFMHTVAWPHVDYIVNKIPNAFNLYDLMQVIIVNMIVMNEPLESVAINITPLGIINKYYGQYDHTDMNYFEDMFAELLKHKPTKDDYEALHQPRYMYNADGEDDGLSDQEIDDIFKAKYERFSAIIDNNVKYESIDEIVGAEDEK